MSVDYSIRWRRKHYVARLDGSDAKYGLRRQFADGKPVKAGGGWLNYNLPAGWYEVQEGYGNRSYWECDGFTMQRMPDHAIGSLDVISSGPAPGQPGAWNGDVCQCGADVAGFDRDGFPHCEDHAPAVRPASSLAVPA